MKSMILKAFFILAMLPLAANADIASDMANTELSLVQVVQNAQNSGMDMGAIVAEMIRVDPSQSNSIVATAMVVQPSAYDSIISSAINAGASPTDVVTVALVANGGKNSDAITQSAVNAAPAGQAAAVRAAASRTQQGGNNLGGPASGVASITPTKGGSAGGGGAASTAEEIATVVASREAAQATIDAVKAQLAAAGFTDSDISTALDSIEMSLRNQETNLAAIAAGLLEVKNKIAAGAPTNEILAGINDAIASASGGQPSS